jgi:hypothetical protein
MFECGRNIEWMKGDPDSNIESTSITQRSGYIQDKEMATNGGPAEDINPTYGELRIFQKYIPFNLVTRAG